VPAFRGLEGPRLEGLLHLLHQAGQLANIFVATRNGTVLKFSSVLSDLLFRCVGANLVLDIVLTGEDTPRERLLEPLKLALHVLLGALGWNLAFFNASVDVLDGCGAVLATLRGTQVHVALVAAQLRPVDRVDEVLNGILNTTLSSFCHPE